MTQSSCLDGRHCACVWCVSTEQWYAWHTHTYIHFKRSQWLNRYGDMIIIHSHAHKQTPATTNTYLFLLPFLSTQFRVQQQQRKRSQRTHLLLEVFMLGTTHRSVCACAACDMYQRRSHHVDCAHLGSVFHLPRTESVHPSAHRGAPRVNKLINNDSFI